MTAPAPRPQPAPVGDPFLDLLARMIRTAHDRQRAERRGNFVVVEGGKR